jgi:nucleoside-specific outer membrane channel protein Tsx
VNARTAARVLRPAAALALAVALAPRAADAQFATTNVQGLYGLSGFEDAALGYDSKSGQMATITVNHFSTWKYGDNFAFVDLYRAPFENGSTSTVYAEWHPRLYLDKLFGGEGDVLGIFRNVALAGEVNQGPSFYAYLGGLGVDFAVPYAGFLTLNVFYRQDSFRVSGFESGNETWQVSPSWEWNFAIGALPLKFAGFVDVYAPENEAGEKKIDVMAQPELMFDCLAPFGGEKNKLFLGVEWYLHYNGTLEEDELVSAPQVMLQWNLH